MPVSVEIRRSIDRFVDREKGRLTRHGFSFGQHYDPARLGFGPMVCHDDHLLGAGQGFADHPHSGLEIVTTVITGELVHRDSTGTAETLRAGEVAVLSAGSGLQHSEVAGAGATRFVQVWLTPDDPGAAPRYRRTTTAAEAGGGLADVGLDIAVGGASYAIARMERGESVTLPAAGRVHAYVAHGALLRSSLAEPLAEGDAFLMTDEPGHEVTAAVPTQLLVWTFD